MLSIGIFLQIYESLIYKAFSLLCSRKFFLKRKLNGQLTIVLFFFAVKILAHVDVTDHSDFSDKTNRKRRRYNNNRSDKMTS